MPLNVLQAQSDADLTAQDDADTPPRQDARALQDHLHSALDANAPMDDFSLSDLPPIVESKGREAPSFGRAVTRQADRIQCLVEEINNLDHDTQFGELRGMVRDLSGALNDVLARMKLDAAEVAERFGMLNGALTIISGAQDMDTPHDSEAVLGSAIAAAERLVSLERLQKEARTAITALEDKASQGQHAVRDMSAGLAKLNAHAESDRNDIARLHQRIEATAQSLAQGLARADNAIEIERNDLARLHQRIESTGQSLAQGLARVDDAMEIERNDVARLQQRIESTGQSLAQGFARVDDAMEIERNDVARLQQRIETAGQSLAQGLARVDDALEAGRNDIARLHALVGSADQTFTEGLTKLDGRFTALSGDVGRMDERLASVESGAAQNAGLKERIEVLSRRLENMEQGIAAQINGAQLRDTERFAVLTNRLEELEQKNLVLSQDAEQLVARLQAAERTIATMTQSQKALSTWQDRLAQVLAGPQLPEG